jgi:UDP-glucose/GDP-mannose dehydrogenase family, UDP binding domain
MPLRAVEAAERHFGGRFAGLSAAVLGITYRAGVEDTRSSPSETVVRALLARGVAVRAHEPLRGAHLAVVCLPDAAYAAELAPLLVREIRDGGLLVDAWNCVAGDVARALAQRGVSTFVYGRGDVPAPDVGAARVGRSADLHDAVDLLPSAGEAPGGTDALAAHPTHGLDGARHPRGEKA